MKTILFVETGSGFGGSATCLAALLRVLDRSRFRPLVAFHSLGPGIDRIKQQGIPVFPLHRETALWQLVRLIRREKVDLVHANNELYSHFSTVLAARWTKRPVLMHMRGIRGLTRMERWLAKRIDAFVMISQASRKFYTQEGIPEALSETIYDGVDLEAFDAQADGRPIRRQLGLLDDHMVVGMVSRMVPKKGHGELLEAAGNLAPAFPSLRVVIVGGEVQASGGYRRQLEARAAELGINSRVIFAGWRDDIPAVNASFDIAVQPTHYNEGLCAAVAEAMAAARPVVATNIGGIPELVVEGKTGYLIEPGDSKALAAALRRLLCDAPLCERLGEEGRARLGMILDLSHTTAQVEAVYERMLEPKES